MSIQVYVTEEDIKNGVKRSAGDCAVALAIKRMVGLGKNVEVENPEVLIGSTNCVRYMLPKEACEFVQDFDDGCLVDPIKFTMNEKPPDIDEEELFESFEEF